MKYCCLLAVVFGVSSGAVVDSRLPFPSDLDWDRIYCFGESVPVAPVAVAAQMALRAQLQFIEQKRTKHTRHRTISTDFLETGVVVASDFLQTGVTSCLSAGDCVGVLVGKFCVAGTCRECSQLSDCPVGNSRVCSSDTQYTCSACGTDTDCGPGGICRFVADLNLSRKRCFTNCGGLNIPVSAVMNSTSGCDWRCPVGQTLGPTDCVACTTCADGQMYVPAAEFSMSQPNSFYPNCPTEASKCVSCPGKANSCAVQLSPSVDWSGRADVGRLGPQYPCGVFECKPDWYLDRSLNQCRQCDYRSCPTGQFLNGCGAANPGTCIPCQANSGVSTNTPYIDPKDVRFVVKVPLDACKPSCLTGMRLSRAFPTYPFTCTFCNNQDACPLGSYYFGCGPDETEGACVPCAMATPPSGSYWAVGCTVSACDFSVCPPGLVLDGCGGSSPGKCVSCPALPENAANFASVLDKAAMKTDTCHIVCNFGFYRVVSPDSGLVVCGKCDPSVCPIGTSLIGCTDNSPGVCAQCLFVPKSFYVPGSNVCETQTCASLPECAPGSHLEGCGGVSSGSCVSCGPLPLGAASWTSGCSVSCASDYFRDEAGRCVACADLSLGCAMGARLDGCGPSSAGTCVACPEIPSDMYWTKTPVPVSPGVIGVTTTITETAAENTTERTDGTNVFMNDASCKTDFCANRVCEAGSVALGCGQADPGVCTPCGVLPLSGTEWTIQNNKCILHCLDDFYSIDQTKCVPCDSSGCEIGQYLSQCAKDQPGGCQPCTPTGRCFVSSGQVNDDPDSCAVSDCPLAV